MIARAESDCTDEDTVWPNTPLPTVADLVALRVQALVAEGVKGVSEWLWMAAGMAGGALLAAYFAPFPL